MKKVLFALLFFVTVLSSCTLSDIPVNPQAVSLIAPLDNEACLDGVSLNDIQSNVSFSWTSDTDAVSYELVLINLFSLKEQTYTSQTNEITIALIKEEPYQWYVRSIGELGSSPAESEQWKFYLAGNAIVNFAPFPSEIIAPRSGSNVTPDANNTIVLNWKASDVDDDLVRFYLYMDEINAVTLKSELGYLEEETSLEVEVENNKTYYWKVLAEDSKGNQSSSGVYAFRTN